MREEVKGEEEEKRKGREGEEEKERGDAPFK